MFQINIIFKNANLVEFMLIKNSPDTDIGCIYRIPCNDCPRIYIDQTEKLFQVRIKQSTYTAL